MFTLRVIPIFFFALCTVTKLPAALLVRANARTVSAVAHQSEYLKARNRDEAARKEGVTLPPAAMAYFKKHEVDASTKRDCEGIFSSPERQKVLEQAQGLLTHNGYYGACLSGIQKNFASVGFTCLRQKPNVFTCGDLPYVFKVPRPWIFPEKTRAYIEQYNANRITFANRLREVAAKNSLNNVVIPQKAIFFTGWDGVDLPHMIVVAQRLNLDNVQPLTLEQDAILQKLAQETGFNDDHNKNVVSIGGKIVILDTEPEEGMVFDYT